MTAQVPLPDELTVWAHACPACLCPVLVGERNSRGWWVCRTCGKRQRTPARVPVRGVGRGGVRW